MKGVLKVTKKGSIYLFFRGRRSIGKLHYSSENGAYEMLVPDNPETRSLTFRIEVHIFQETDEDERERRGRAMSGHVAPCTCDGTIDDPVNDPDCPRHNSAKTA